MERLLIVRLGHMGDIIHALPAVAALRQAFPAARLGWAVEERWAELLRAASDPDVPSGTPSKPLVDALHLVNTQVWRRALLSDRTWKDAQQSLLALRAACYDAVVDFQGLWITGMLARWSDAPERYGFRSPKERPAALFYTRLIEATDSQIIYRNLDLARGVTGRPPASIDFPLPHDPAAEAWCNAELRRRRLTQFALLSPGAGWGAKLWPAERYAQVARALAAQGLPSVINFGPGQAALARAVEEAGGGAAQALSCSIGELIALTRRAQLFIGGDTGPMHLASALGVPVVAIFGPTSPDRNGPFGTRAVVLRSPASRTSYSHTARADQGLLSIAADDVLAAARGLLGLARA